MVLRSVCMFSAVATAWSADTTCTEEESLMQGQARHLMVGRSSPSRLDFRTNNVSAFQLLESVKGMAGTVNSMERIEPEAVSSFEDAIDAATAVLVSSKTLINTEHGNAQEAIDVAGAALHDCSDSELSGAQTFNYFEGLVHSNQQTHQTCRNVEHALTVTRNTECSAMDDWITSFEQSADHALTLRHENADGLGPELTRVKNFAQDGFEQWQTKHTNCRTAERTLADHPQREGTAAGGGGCNPEQAAFEVSYCSRWTTCLTFEDCWQREKRELDAIVDLENTNRGLRQNEWLALHHSECLLGLIRAAITADPPEQVDPDAMQSCEQTHGSESALPEELRSFDLPDTTKDTYCVGTQASPDPCSPEFLDAEYSSFEQRATMPICTPCQRPPASGGEAAPAEEVEMWTQLPGHRCAPSADAPETFPRYYKTHTPWEDCKAHAEYFPTSIALGFVSDGHFGWADSPMGVCLIYFPNREECDDVGWGDDSFVTYRGEIGRYYDFCRTGQVYEGEIVGTTEDTEDGLSQCWVKQMRAPPPAAEETSSTWTLVMQYGTEAYQWNRLAIGTPSESETGAAKLSDFDINALPKGANHGGMLLQTSNPNEYTYYKLTSDKPHHDGERQSFIMRTAMAYDDSDSKYGFATGGTQFCRSTAEDQSREPSIESPGACTRWEGILVDGHLDTRNWHNGCDRWYAGFHGRFCSGPVSSDHHCWDGGCGMRQNFKMYKCTGDGC